MSILLNLFTRNYPDDDTALDAEFEAAAERHLAGFDPKCQPTILDRSASVVSDFLSHARTEKARLEGEIADRQERLRQTNVAIDAFAPVLIRLEEGYDAADDAKKSYEAAVEAKRKRGDRHFRKPALQAAE
ncbi:hypothetical protein [Rhizobiales bacterium 3FA27D7]|jgi:hypothetical protein|uniref:hypothetical protein n=1 Tax=Mesorhizobium sp. 2RAF21 TaxID=3232995 RepID=UPI0010F8101D